MNSVTQLFAGIFEIAALLVSLAVLAVLIKNASGTASVIQASSSGFSDVLATAMGNSGGAMGIH